MDHIKEVLDELEAIILQAKADGREPADVLADNHMVFMGPPGTGKTTVCLFFLLLNSCVLNIVMNSKCGLTFLARKSTDDKFETDLYIRIYDLYNSIYILT